MNHKSVYVGPNRDFKNDELEELLDNGWEIIRADPSITTVTLGPNTLRNVDGEGGMYYILVKNE